MNNLEQHIEALIFSAEQSISLEEIKAVVEASLEIQLNPVDLTEAIENIRTKYADPGIAIELVELANGFIFLTKRSSTQPSINYRFIVQRKNSARLP